MNLYIKIQDGQPINHPAYDENLIQAFGAVPEGWEPFVRVERPAIGNFEVLGSEEPAYKKVAGVWTDVWEVRPMTEQEKVAKRQIINAEIVSHPQGSNWAAWVADEATGKLKPPIPRPPKDVEKEAVGIYTYWCGAENGWKDTPPKPVGEDEYIFNFIAWQWFKVVNL